MTLETVLDRLELVHRNGAGYTARCPAHPDQHPSLSIGEGEDGKILVHCHTGCAPEAIVAALGLEMSDLFADGANGPGAPVIVNTYDYTDEGGRTLFQVVRYSPKTFRVRRPDPNVPGDWIWNLDGTRRVLYSLPYLVSARKLPDPPAVYVVEGEKDADAVMAAGQLATTNPGGAGKWRDEYSDQLARFPVLVVADRDDAGRRHAAQVAASLEALAASVQVVEPAEGNDISDHLAAGRTLAELAPATTTPAHNWQPASLLDLAANPPTPPTIAGLVYERKRHVWSGETESLKTWLALIVAKAEMDSGYPVVWVDIDAMGPDEILERLRSLKVPDETIDRLFLYVSPTETLTGLRLDELCKTITTRGVRLVVIDAFNGILTLHGLDPSSTPDIEQFWQSIANPITEAGAAVLLLDHVTKNPDSRGRYAIGSERKASGAHVHTGFKTIGQPLERGRTGKARLTTHKDRSGFLPRPVIGELVLDSDGKTISYRLDPDTSRNDEGGFRPTGYMEKVSRAVEPETGPVSKNWIEQNVTGRAEYKRLAITTLIEDGYLDATGDGIRSIRPYRKADDTPEDVVTEDDAVGSSRVRPGFVPNLRSTPHRNLVPRPPFTGVGTNRVDKDEPTSSRPRPQHPDTHENNGRSERTAAPAATTTTGSITPTGAAADKTTASTNTTTDTLPCGHTDTWTARDQITRCRQCEPPRFSGEVLATGDTA